MLLGHDRLRGFRAPPAYEERRPFQMIRIPLTREALFLRRDTVAGVGMNRNEEQWRSAILGGTSNGNRLSGKVYRGNEFWIAELPALDAMTQGRSKDDAYAMVKDMLETLVNLPGFSVRVSPDDEDGFVVIAQVPSQWEPAGDDSGQIVGPPGQVVLVTSE